MTRFSTCSHVHARAVAHHHSTIKAAYNWAIDELLAANPAQRVKNAPALRPKVRSVWRAALEAAQAESVEAAAVLDNIVGLASRRH